MLADGQLQALTGAAADGGQWLAKARRTLRTATGAVGADPDSAFTLAYDAARFACTALLAQQGLRNDQGRSLRGRSCRPRPVRCRLRQVGGLRRQRNDIEYPVMAAARLTPADARFAIAVATELADAAEQLLPHLGLFG